MAKFRLYTASWCSHCPTAKKIVVDAGLDCEVVDIDTPYGRVKAISDGGIMAVPTLLKFDTGGKTVILQKSGTQINTELCEKLRGR